jgi:hypothetical protein
VAHETVSGQQTIDALIRKYVHGDIMQSTIVHPPGKAHLEEIREGAQPLADPPYDILMVSQLLQKHDLPERPLQKTPAESGFYSEGSAKTVLSLSIA